MSLPRPNRIDMLGLVPATDDVGEVVNRLLDVLLRHSRLDADGVVISEHPVHVSELWNVLQPGTRTLAPETSRGPATCEVCAPDGLTGRLA